MFWSRKRSTMNPKPAVSNSAKHIKILEGLLKLPENKKCADCRSKAPRWASINLGIFICLQCSGIHRSLGVHISKVRSTTLDTWLPEQVAFMQSVGNDKSNAYWEAELPSHYDRNQIESFIHAKYVEKRWIPRDSRAKLISNSSSKEQLTSSRSSRRFGAIAEWTNNQHVCKERRDCSTAERDRASSSPSIGNDLTGYKIEQHQQQEKKENFQLSMKPSTLKSTSVNGRPFKEPAQVIPRIHPNASLWKSEHELMKTKSSTANAMNAVPSSKVDSELFITLCMDDSSDNDSSFDTSSWVHFDSDQESSTPETKIVPKPAVEKALIHEEKLTVKSSASKVNPEPTTMDVQMVTAPFSNGQSSEHQKYVTNDNRILSEKPNMDSMPSVHLQRLAMLAEGVSATNTPTSARSIHHQMNVNGNGAERTIGTQIPLSQVQNSQTVKSGLNSAPYTMSSAIPLRRVSTAPSRRPPAALPVSGYDYDFSFLTQGMFTKR